MAMTCHCAIARPVSTGIAVLRFTTEEAGEMRGQILSKQALGHRPVLSDPLEGRLTLRRWYRIAAALPAGIHLRASRGLTTRRFVEAVLWAAVRDATWPQLPNSYGNYQAVSQRFDRWVRLDIWSVVIVQLHGDRRVPALERIVTSRREVFARRSSGLLQRKSFGETAAG